jgi:hypothetical protein
MGYRIARFLYLMSGTGNLLMSSSQEMVELSMTKV